MVICTGTKSIRMNSPHIQIRSPATTTNMLTVRIFPAGLPILVVKFVVQKRSGTINLGSAGLSYQPFRQ